MRTGVLRYGERFASEETELLGLPMLLVTLPPGTGLVSRMALRRAGRLLRRRGIRECLLPGDFPLRDRWERLGFAPPDARPLLREMAGRWTLLERRRLGLSGDIALAAASVTPEAERAARYLLERTGQVALPRSPGAEELQWRLRRESGASLRLLPWERLAGAETLLHFAEEDLRGRRLTLSLARPSPPPRFLLPPELMAALPPEVDGGALAALLWRRGRLRAEEIGLKSGK